jgi:hypothetical protein
MRQSEALGSPFYIISHEGIIRLMLHHVFVNPKENSISKTEIALLCNGITAVWTGCKLLEFLTSLQRGLSQVPAVCQDGTACGGESLIGQSSLLCSSCGVVRCDACWCLSLDRHGRAEDITNDSPGFACGECSPASQNEVAKMAA